jgi:hypothetical protein
VKATQAKNAAPSSQKKKGGLFGKKKEKEDKTKNASSKGKFKIHIMDT